MLPPVAPRLARVTLVRSRSLGIAATSPQELFELTSLDLTPMLQRP